MKVFDINFFLQNESEQETISYASNFNTFQPQSWVNQPTPMYLYEISVNANKNDTPKLNSGLSDLIRVPSYLF